MHYENLEKKLIQQQNLYIRQLEGQLAVYKEKDRTQEIDRKHGACIEYPVRWDFQVKTGKKQDDSGQGKGHSPA